MTTAMTAGVQTTVAIGGEMVKSGWGGTVVGSGPTSTYLCRNLWKVNRPNKQLRVRRTMRCEASVKGLQDFADEARRSSGEAARAVSRKADQVFDDVKAKV